LPLPVLFEYKLKVEEDSKTRQKISKCIFILTAVTYSGTKILLNQYTTENRAVINMH